MIDIIIPKNENLNCAGVYKLTLENGFFYIGSTKNFRKRFSSFVTVLRNKHKLHSKSIYQHLDGCKFARFEILKVVNNYSDLRLIETEIMQTFIGNQFILNRSFDANSNKGIRWTNDERAKVSASMRKKYSDGTLKPTAYKYKKNGNVHTMKPVIMVNITTNVSEIFPSLKKAAEFIKSAPESIRTQINGNNKRKKHHKGYIFKYA